jgi:pilus assembly protein TadC
VILLVLIFILIAAAITLILGNFIQSRQDVRLKIPDSFPSGAKPATSKIKQSRLVNASLKRLGFVINPLSRLPYFVNLQTQAEILRINLDLPVLLLIKLVAAVAAIILVPILFSPVFTLLGGIVGFFLPDFFVWGKVKDKKAAIVRIFPETVDLLDMCINAGADFLSAIKWVVEKSSSNPFIEQLAIVLSEIQVGKTRSQALKDMANRLKLPDISSFVRTIIQSERMGTSIEESFRNLSEDTREKRFREGERYAIRASLKILFPLLFCILPAIMIVVAGPIIIKFTSGELTPKGF